MAKANDEKEIQKNKSTKRKPIKKVDKNDDKVKNIKKEEIKQVEIKENKNNKMKYTLKDILIILVLAIVFGFLLGSAITKHCAKKSVKELKEVDKIYNDIVENHYEELDDKNINSSIIDGMVEGLNDKYAYYYKDKDGILNYNEAINGYFIGLGVQIKVNDEGKIVVIDVYDDSPAKKAGILQNDIIIKMNDDEYDINNFNDLIYNIKSSKVGDKVKIELKRNDETKEVEVALEKVDIESVTYDTRELNGKNIGIITINNFANNSYDQFMKSYKELTSEKVSGLVIDVRNNTEGTLENAAKIASLFLAKDSVIYMKNGKEKIKSEDERVVDIPTVIVVDETTVSTAEMFASSLNENLNAPLVGERTYGKGLMQKLIKLANGRFVQHTTEEWRTSKNVIVEGFGITPTIEVKCADETCENDVQLEKAIEIITSQMGQV